MVALPTNYLIFALILAAGVAMFRRVPAVLGLCSMVALLPAMALAAPSVREAALRTFIAAPGNNVVRSQRANGTVEFLGANPNTPIPETSLLRRTEDRAQAFLKSNRNLFVDAATPLTLVPTRVQDNDAVGISHVRLQQMFHGIPVRGAEAVVRMSTTGITAVNSKLISAPDLSITPVISSDAALRIAQTVVLKIYGPVPAAQSVPQLEILDVGLFHGQPGQPQLTWFITASGDALSERIWVNAVSGALAYNYSQLTEARNRRTFDANNGSIISAAAARSETQPPLGVPDIDNAFDFVGDFWNYFYTVLGRDSYDGNGATLISVVRYCNSSTGCPFKGAYWDGTLSVQRIFLGAGYATDDVIAHELTHAVIDNTSNLIYAGESGALNESYADIFGETIDLWNGKGNDASSVRWLIGEELPGYIGIGIRNLLDPASLGQPGRVTDSSYLCDAVDNFRVHNNSGVANHAYALMVDGGTYNGYSISGIGLEKAAKIQYRTLQLLPAASRLVDNFNGLNQACSELVGNYGITHDDCAQVKAAALAVEMTTPPCDKNAKPPAPPSAGPAPVPVAVTQCPVGQVVQYAFGDDFENTTSGNWVTSSSSGGNHWLGGAGTPAIYVSTRPERGSFGLHGQGIATLADSSVMMKNDVTLPARALLQFASSYDFESGFDGGVVEYSVDAGSTWQDAGPMITFGRNYDGVLFNGATNPLRGRAAFTGHTGGTYVNSQLDLSSLAGRKVRFRFRMGTDNLVASPGWWIDNLSIHGCATTSGGLTITPIQGLRTSEAGGAANFTVVLRSMPTANVTLTMESSNIREGTVSPSVVTFTPQNWNIPKTVTMTGVDDSVDDGDVSYSVTTSVTGADPSYNNLVAPSIDLVNVNNDVSALVVTPTNGLVTSEAGGTATFTVVLSSQPTADVTLSLISSNRREGRVITPASETFTAANWNQARIVIVKGVDDNVTDGNTAYFVAVKVSSSGDPKYSALGELRVNAINLDNDSARFIVYPTAGLTTSEAGGQATFLVRLSSQPTASVTLNIASNNPAEGTLSPSTLTFSSANWDVPQAVTVTGVDDNLVDGNIQYTVVLSPAVSGDPNYKGVDAPDITLVNIDNDVPNILIAPGPTMFTTESGGIATFTLALSKMPTGNVSIELSSSAPTEGNVNRSTIVFTASNWNKPTLVTVTGVDDNMLDGDMLYSIITAPAISGDIAYSGMNAPDVFLVNRDNDTAALVIDPSTRLTTTETAGIATFKVSLAKQPVSDVILLSTSSNTAEGVVTSKALVFTIANWNIPQTITVVGQNDNVADGDINYNVLLDLSNSDDPNYRALPVQKVELINRANENQPVQPSGDPAKLIVNAANVLVTTEDAGTATFTVALNKPPTGEVNIFLASSNESEGIVRPTLLTFTASDWDRPKMVRVVGVNDSVIDGDVGYQVTLTVDPATTVDFQFVDLPTIQLKVTNQDNDKIATGALGAVFLVALFGILMSRRRLLR